MRNPSPDITDPKPPLIRPGLKTPRAATIAGIVFSLLLSCSLWLFWQAVPVSPHETGSWLKTGSERVSLALNLIPFAGVAFLWFLGVLRDRLGEKEDQFFATVFLAKRSPVPWNDIRYGFGYGRSHPCLFSCNRRASRLSFILFRPRFRFWRHANLRIQDGCGFYGRDVYAGHKDPACYTFHCIAYATFSCSPVTSRSRPRSATSTVTHPANAGS